MPILSIYVTHQLLVKLLQTTTRHIHGQVSCLAVYSDQHTLFEWNMQEVLRTEVEFESILEDRRGIDLIHTAAMLNPERG
jgi:hypothetical protein